MSVTDRMFKQSPPKYIFQVYFPFPNVVYELFSRRMRKKYSMDMWNIQFGLSAYELAGPTRKS